MPELELFLDTFMHTNAGDTRCDKIFMVHFQFNMRAHLAVSNFHMHLLALSSCPGRSFVGTFLEGFAYHHRKGRTSRYPHLALNVDFLQIKLDGWMTHGIYPFQPRLACWKNTFWPPTSASTDLRLFVASQIRNLS